MGGSAPRPDPNVGLAQKEMADIASRSEARADRESQYFTDNFAPRYLSQMDQQLAQSQQMQDYTMGLSRKYDQRYWDTTARQQDKFYGAVDQYDTGAERDRIGRQAGADVEQASAMGMQEMQRNLARRGVNPGSGAAMAAMGDMQMDSALARAGAMTMAQEAARREGLNLRGVAAGMGGNLSGTAQGYAGQAGATIPMGMQGISGAQQGFAANSANNNATMGLASNSWNGIGQMGASMYGAQANYAGQQAAGNGALLGSVVGAAAMFF